MRNVSPGRGERAGGAGRPASVPGCLPLALSLCLRQPMVLDPKPVSHAHRWYSTCTWNPKPVFHSHPSLSLSISLPRSLSRSLSPSLADACAPTTEKIAVKTAADEREDTGLAVSLFLSPSLFLSLCIYSHLSISHSLAPSLSFAGLFGWTRVYSPRRKSWSKQTPTKRRTRG